MDPSLLRERESFLKRASAVPVIQERKRLAETHERSSSPATKAKKQKSSKSGAQGASQIDYKAAQSSHNAAHFRLLFQIVDHMKERHLKGDSWGLSLSEILEELRAFDVSKQAEKFLLEAIPRNPKLTTAKEDESKFVYKPPYRLKGKNSLLNLLKKHDIDNRGAVLMSELKASMPNPDKAILELGDQVFSMQVAKKKDEKVFFFNDVACFPEVDEEFKQMWRSTTVAHMDDEKIEKYLEEHGFSAMKDEFKRGPGNIPKRKQRVRRKNIVLHNDHMEGVLQDFTAP